MQSAIAALFLIQLSSLAVAAPAPLVKKFQDASAQVHAIYGKFEQLTWNKTLGTERKQVGEFQFQKPTSFRWKFDEMPSRTYLGTGKVLWIVERGADDKIGRILKDSKFQLNKSKIAFLLTHGGDITRDFRVMDISTADRKIKVVPKSAADGIRELELTIGEKNNLLEKIRFVDELGNQTEIRFTEMHQLTKREFNGLPKQRRDDFEKRFQFTPPQGHEIIEAQHAQN
jgi:outer membrane lipoprotein-sorting protein